MFDLGVDPWGDNPTFHMPVFVITKNARESLIKEGGTTYFFVTDGIESALDQARELPLVTSTSRSAAARRPFSSV